MKANFHFVRRHMHDDGELFLKLFNAQKLGLTLTTLKIFTFQKELDMHFQFCKFQLTLRLAKIGKV